MDDKKIEELVNGEDNQMGIIVYIPKRTIKLELTCTIMDDEDNSVRVGNTMNVSELYDARIAGDQWEGENVKYCLTDLGRAELEAMKQ